MGVVPGFLGLSDVTSDALVVPVALGITTPFRDGVIGDLENHGYSKKHIEDHFVSEVHELISNQLAGITRLGV